MATFEGPLALTLRRLNAREMRLVAVTGLVVVTGIFLRWRSAPGSPSAASARAAETKLDELPRIDLARLDASPKPSKAGERDIFEFGRAPVAEAPEPAATPEPESVSAVELTPTPPPAPVLPPLNVKFIGSLDNSRGMRVAVLMTDKNEILTGKVGEVVANRYKIEKIGFESVDIQDVTSGQTRRIPLRSK